MADDLNNNNNTRHKMHCDAFSKVFVHRKAYKKKKNVFEIFYKKFNKILAAKKDTDPYKTITMKMGVTVSFLKRYKKKPHGECSF